MVVGSFKKIFDSQRIEFIPQVQSVVDPGVTGSKHMGDPPLRLDRYPTLVVAEQAGHSVESMVTATNPDSTSHRATSFTPLRRNTPFTVSPQVFHALRQISRLDS